MRRLVVAVTGGRRFHDESAICAALDVVHHVRGIGLLVQGGQTGADRLADNWACWRDISGVTVRAWWACKDYQADRGEPCVDPETGRHRGAPHGKPAGPERNRRMLEEHAVQLLVAFPGHRGTSSCVSIARSLDIEVIEVLR